jgi:hypothetical protein
MIIKNHFGFLSDSTVEIYPFFLIPNINFTFHLNFHIILIFGKDNEIETIKLLYAFILSYLPNFNVKAGSMHKNIGMY